MNIYSTNINSTNINKSSLSSSRQSSSRQSSHRRVRTGLVSAGLLLACSISQVVSAASEIPDVTVSASRTEQSTLATPAAIRIINREEIRRSGATHITQVLRARGGVQINDLYGDGSRASVGMRGFNETASSNTLILIDGRRLNNPDIASPDLNSISLDDVERIEIVRGSAGVLFGDQAVGGVINIITLKPDQQQHKIKLSAGSYNNRMFHGATSRALDNGLNYRLSLDAQESDNYREHNESSYLNGFARLGYEYSAGSVFAEAQYVDDELNTPGTLFDNELAADRRQVSANFAGDFSNAETTVGRLGLIQEIAHNWSFEGELTHRDVEGVFRLSSVFGAETQDSTQDRTVNEFTPRFIGFLPALNDSMLTLGADLVDSDYQLNSRFGDQHNDQKQQSLYAQLLVPVSEALDVTMGLRYAEVENDLMDSGAFALYPNGIAIDDDLTVATFGLSWAASKQWRLLARADQNYRFAKVDEFLQPAYTPTFTPVVLETQEGISYEAGLEWISGEHTASLGLYRLELDREIAYDPVNFANINLDETQRQGLIASGRWQVTRRTAMYASYTLTDAEVKSGAFSGKDIPFVARHSGRVAADYRLNSAWLLYGELAAVSERVMSGDFDNVLEKLPGYGLVNIRASYQYKQVEFAARVNNLLDKAYSDVAQLGADPLSFAPRAAYFPSPERNVLLTATWRYR